MDANVEGTVKEREQDRADQKVGASAEAIQYHYDIGNDFLALAQDLGRNYS
jgi:cyclopropane-fatty-acyl-phospholipid synthase